MAKRTFMNINKAKVFQPTLSVLMFLFFSGLILIISENKSTKDFILFFIGISILVAFLDMLFQSNLSIYNLKHKTHHVWMLCFLLTSGFLLLVINSKNNLIPAFMPDEGFYINILNIWERDGLSFMYTSLRENKTLPYLYLLKLFGANIVYTRALNVVLILINTFMLYKLSNGRKLALVYPMFPIFLYSMWLTVETIEIFFILAGFLYFKKKYMGIAVGLACLIRPYATLYTVFLYKSTRNLMYVFIIGIACCIFLYAHDVLWIYFGRIFTYGSSTTHITDDLIAVMLMPLLIFAGFRNYAYSKYAFASMIGLIVQFSAHYFLVPYTLFFLAYLTMKQYREGKIDVW